MPPIADTEGLAPHEIAALVIIAENIDSPSDNVQAYIIKEDMQRAGFNRIATTLALTMLLRKKMIVDQKDYDRNDNECFLYTISDKGMQWLLENKDKLVLKKQKPEPKLPLYPSNDDIPF
ncbi:hypothetical protein J7L67_08535 [bacterium]|nr:hypothetical protein [bacterium]